MFMHNKRLMYTVRVGQTNPKLANYMLEQFGGPQGELAAAMRYFTQAINETDPGRKDMLMDIATEELSHLEVIGSMVVMLCKGVKGELAEGVEEAESVLDIGKEGADHLAHLAYGAGAALINSNGVPWTAAYIDSIGDPSCDLRSNIAAESRAKITYERLINICDDGGIREALGFLMTREIAHQKSFEKALYSIEPNFPPGKLPGDPNFTNKYYDMSQGEGQDVLGSWNSGPNWEHISDREQQSAVDGGDGKASVKLTIKEKKLEKTFAQRTMSNPEADPVTGAELGSADI